MLIDVSTIAAFALAGINGKALSVLVLSQNTASQFLSRRRRANSLFEESKKGNLERECIEEVCNKEEAREIFENHPETVRAPTPFDGFAGHL
ncbi:hypothetical protein XENOCAPTIV_005474 [Xenoophorus captivus]|uniref:Gla domain-containing protein n=1 Tax=Xenoophorus captivus TaxID=1517983 RepID=A0ABV0RYV6_9TELE